MAVLGNFIGPFNYQFGVTHTKIAFFSNKMCQKKLVPIKNVNRFFDTIFK